MRRMLVLVHCQEANRPSIEEAFIGKLVGGVRDGNFDEVIHLSASNIWGVENSPITGEICDFVNRIVEWDHHELLPFSS
jgi:hypothetical protein